jgi:hypothetical protein
VLESAAVCPGCHHHLRFGGSGTQSPDETYSALSLDGTISHRGSDKPCEYCIVVDVRSERGETLVRQVVGVGALQPGDLRRVNVSIDMMPVRTTAAAKAAAAKAPSAPTATPLAAKAAGPAAGAAGAPATSAPPAAAGARPGQPPGGGAAEAAKGMAAPLLNPPQPGAKPPSSGPLMPGRPTQRMRIFPKR